MKNFIIVFFLFCTIFLFSYEQTVEFEDDGNLFWSGERAKSFYPQQVQAIFSKEKITYNRSWTVMDSIPLRYFLNSISTGGRFVDIYFNRADNSLHTFCSDPVSITQTATEAIGRAPEWIRAELRLKFQSIPGNKQNLWANLILNTPDPYVDEVAFSVATLSPAYLMSSLANTDVILANAMQIYLNDINISYSYIINFF